MKDTKFRNMIDLYEETKNLLVLERIRKLYGDIALLEMGKTELKLFVDVSIYGKYENLYNIDTVATMRLIYNDILDRLNNEVENESDELFISNFIKFLNEFNFLNSSIFSRSILKENETFLFKLISTKKELFTNENYYDYTDDYIDAILTNTNILVGSKYNLYDFHSKLANSNMSIHKYIISHMNIYEDAIYNISNLLNRFNIIYNTILYNDDILPNDKEKIINEGLDDFFDNRFWQYNGFSLMCTLCNMKSGLIQILHDTCVLFFTRFLINSKYILENVIDEYQFDKENGHFVLESIVRNVDKYTLNGLFQLILFGKTMIEDYYNFLFYDDTGIKEKITNVHNGIDLLVYCKIIPEISSTDIRTAIDNLVNINTILENPTNDIDEELKAILEEDDED